MQTRTCSQGASVSGTDDSQMFLSRHYDSRDHVCLWGQPLKLHCLELDLWLHSHNSCNSIHGPVFEGCKSLDLCCFEWILRSDIKAPGTAQVKVKFWVQ